MEAVHFTPIPCEPNTVKVQGGEISLVLIRLLAVCFSLVIGGGYEARRFGKRGMGRDGHTTPRLLFYTANAICVRDD